MTFKHRFQSGVTVTIEITDPNTPPKFIWENGQPTRAVVDEYLVWASEVFQLAANNFQKKILYVLPDPKGRMVLRSFFPKQ